MTVRELRRALFQLENQEAEVVIYLSDTKQYKSITAAKKFLTPNVYVLEMTEK